MGKDFYLNPGYQDILKEKYDNGLPWIRKRILKMTCTVCGKSFYKPGEGVIKYCSDECEMEAARGRRKAAQQPPRPCAECGKAFIPVRKDTLYCSSACRQKAFRKRSKE